MCSGLQYWEELECRREVTTCNLADRYAVEVYENFCHEEGLPHLSHFFFKIRRISYLLSDWQQAIL